MLTLTSPYKTWAHGLPAGAKLIALAAVTMSLFALKTPLALGLATLGVAALIATGGPAFAKESARLLRPLWPIALIITLWHLATHDLSGGAVILLRMGAALAAANFVTMTTRLSDMLAVMQRALSPLHHLGLPAKPVAIALALVIRFIPVMLERFDTLSTAFRARSARRPGWRILMPAALAALDDAEHVAEALRARGGAV